MKNIIITGTSRGIGLELALLFASQGHQVAAISRKVAPQLLGNPNITCLSIISNLIKYGYRLCVMLETRTL